LLLNIKCVNNGYYGYGCAFTLNSSKQFCTRGTSKPRASAERWNRGESWRSDWGDCSP